jgi:hypothetical protein
MGVFGGGFLWSCGFCKSVTLHIVDQYHGMIPMASCPRDVRVRDRTRALAMPFMFLETIHLTGEGGDGLFARLRQKVQ